jgi:hypothetical protein
MFGKLPLVSLLYDLQIYISQTFVQHLQMLCAMKFFLV